MNEFVKIKPNDENMTKTVGIMPWLHLKSHVMCFGVKFTSYQRDIPLPNEYKTYKDQINRILSSYVNLEGEPITECVLIGLDGYEACGSLNDSELDKIVVSAEILAFCALSKNEFFGQTRLYTNRSFFDLYFQNFKIADSNYISIPVRRRDGSLLMGGHEHGKIFFSVPIQCSSQQLYKVDQDLLSALEKAQGPQIRRIKQSIMLFNQANTDSNAIMANREIVLLASAYEQLFDDCFGANDLACKIATLLNRYSSVKVEQSSRKEQIKIDKPEESEWYLNRKWIQELYHLRNAFIHGNELSERTWGWSLLEHLVMSTFLFPRIVKIILAEQSVYSLSEEDLQDLYCVDNLLDLKDWAKGSEKSRNITNWEETLQHAFWIYAKQKLMARCQQEQSN